jgi:hypothetical protein
VATSPTDPTSANAFRTRRSGVRPARRGPQSDRRSAEDHAVRRSRTNTSSHGATFSPASRRRTDGPRTRNIALASGDTSRDILMADDAFLRHHVRNRSRYTIPAASRHIKVQFLLRFRQQTAAPGTPGTYKKPLYRLTNLVHGARSVAASICSDPSRARKIARNYRYLRNNGRSIGPPTSGKSFASSVSAAAV